MTPRVLLPLGQQIGPLLLAPVFHSIQQIKHQVTVGSYHIHSYRLSYELSIYNLSNNILRLFDVLPTCSFTTSETDLELPLCSQ